MNRFRKYLTRLDDVQEQARKLAGDLEAMYETARQKAAFYHADRIGEPTRGALDPDEYVKALEWRAKLAAAARSKTTFWENLPDTTRQKIAEIRREFAAELDDVYSADPAKLDKETIALLESGICDAHEYTRLLDKATRADNTTLARVIGAYATKAAEKLDADPATPDSAAAEYRAVAEQAAGIGRRADSYMGFFDVYADAIQRATVNPPMLSDALDELSANAIMAFDTLG